MINAQILQDLHDSEINGSVDWFFDKCWRAGIGDNLNGWKSEKRLDTLGEAIEWLRDEAIRLYPDSDFAKRYGRGFF